MFAGTKFREIEIDDPMSLLFLFYKITLTNNFNKTNMLSLLDSCITLPEPSISPNEFSGIEFRDIKARSRYFSRILSLRTL